MRNRPGSTAARRDKWQMAQALLAAGVPVLRQVCTDDPAGVARWIADTGLAGRRLVVKPPKSGGTEDVYLVAAGADWRLYFDLLLHAPNRFGDRNEAVLVQEFAEGTEYVLDTYSVAGRLGLAQVCRYSKRTWQDRIGIYDSTEVLPPDHLHVEVLADYTCRVAAAVGLRNGCGHAEAMLTADGPRLVEIAVRLAGNPAAGLPAGHRGFAGRPDAAAPAGRRVHGGLQPRAAGADRLPVRRAGRPPGQCGAARWGSGAAHGPCCPPAAPDGRDRAGHRGPVHLARLGAARGGGPGRGGGGPRPAARAGAPAVISPTGSAGEPVSR